MTNKLIAILRRPAHIVFNMKSIYLFLFIVTLSELQFIEYDNLALIGTATKNGTISTESNGFQLSSDFSAPGSLEILGSLHPSETQLFTFTCSQSGPLTTWFVFLGDHMVCVSDIYKYSEGAWDNPLTLKSNQEYVVRLEFYVKEAGSLKFVLEASDSSSVTAPLNFSPSMPSSEMVRRNLQKNLISNWGNWLHHDLLTFVLLPEGSAFQIGFCDGSDCVGGSTMPDKSDDGIQLRVGPISYDKSFGQFYASWDKKNLNVSISFSATKEEDLYLSVEVISSQCSTCEMILVPRYPWDRAGDIEIANQSITLKAYNMRTTTLRITPPGTANVAKKELRALLSNGVFLSTTDATPDQISSFLTEARKNEFARYDKYSNLSEVKFATQAGVMWNMVYTPAELGPMAPVSRAWDFTSLGSRGSKDFGYVLFDWDNIFASYLLGLDNREWTYSNLIQIIKSKTAAGFVPNFAAGGKKSQDRTEPPIGAFVVRELYNKYKDKWLVECLFQDLVDWNDWFFSARILGPLNMIVLGSSHRFNYDDTGSETMQGARYESGLDNSPMYDGDFFNKSINLMELYDVGMNSMVVAECDALVDLANLLGMSDVAQRMQSRANKMRDLIRENLWDEDSGIYVNKFRNGTFYRRVSPTSFYVMMAKVPTESQIERMIKEWLQNPKRFCITPDWPASNSEDCYWGLPSISADDPAFPPLGYWRGYVWGPMAQLTYWSLNQYKDNELVNSARKQLCKQMTAMMLNQWHLNRHICENFSPHHQASDCTGTKFYHWGALAGLISLIEEGYY